MRSSSLVNFTLSSDDRENTVVFGPSGEPLYFVETATIEFGTAPTRIYRADPKGYESKYLVAIIEFHRYRPATITYMGETRDLRDMYPKKGWPSRSRLMPSPFGKCKWSVSNKRPELYDSSRRLIMTYESNTGTFTENKPPRIRVTFDTLVFLELVIMGWIVTMKDIGSRETRERR